MDDNEVQLRWYALKVFYNKVFEIEDELIRAGLETYIPVRKDELKGDEFHRIRKRLATPDESRNDRRYEQAGPKIYKRVTIVASLLFVRCPDVSLPWIESILYDRGFIYKTADRKKPSVIPDRQMDMFRLVTASGDENLEFFSDESITRYAQGDKVRVKAGPLKGAEGYIKRIRRDRRLLVAIEGFIAVATSYIPPQLLEKVSD